MGRNAPMQSAGFRRGPTGTTAAGVDYDIVIVGGGPAGLSAALTLGRACKRVLLCDAGSRRNAAAEHMHNFVTRDGTPPAEFRGVGRDQLAAYPDVEARDIGVQAITGERGAFQVELSDGRVTARRILLATGMVDKRPPIAGLAELWGKSIFQCPYCHGWEVRGRRFGVLVHQPELFDFAPFLRGWSPHVTAFTDGRSAAPPEVAARLAAAGVQIDERAIAKLVGGERGLERIVFADGGEVACEVLFAHPHQEQVPLVRALDLALDEAGYVRVDPMTRETSVPGIYAGGDLVTRMQAAVMAAALGMQAAAALNHALTVELAMNGSLA